MYGSTRGTYPSNVSATIGGVGGTPLGQAAITLTVDDAAPPQLTVVQGSGQKAVIGTTYAQPFGLRVTRSGAPVANAVVTFHVCDGTRDTTFCAGAPITASGTFTGGDSAADRLLYGRCCDRTPPLQSGMRGGP